MTVAVVPMKPLARTKCRLCGVLPEPQLRHLVNTMLCDVLKSLGGSGEVERVFVITADYTIVRLARQFGAGSISEPAATGLNEAVGRAARHLTERGAGSMLVLPGDVPLASAQEIDAFVVRCEEAALGIVPAHDGDGTNALLLTPPEAIAPSFGKGSFARHLAAARRSGLRTATCDLEGLRRDIDTRRDLEFLFNGEARRPGYEFLSDTIAHSGAGTSKRKERRWA